MTATLDTVTTADLAAIVAGPVFEPGDDGYAAEVASFSMIFAAVPAVVVGATSADDVAATVAWAARAGLSVFHFARAFRVSTGLTPRAFVETRRIARARQLIAGTTQPLAALAVDTANVGMASASAISARVLPDSPILSPPPG